MANPIRIQKQIKDNAEDLHNFVRDLKLWEEEMKRKDHQLNTDHSNEEVLPPVRRVKLSDKTSHKTEVSKNNVNKRIPSSDYKRWDKFDVEKACEDIDNEEIKDLETDEEDVSEQNEKYMKETALYEKELGNQHVKAGKWDAAITAYTKAITAYPKDPIFYANRALCCLKKKKWNEVEADCTEALKLDPTYVKAYLRRAVAREALERLEDTKHDLSQVLRLEPGNTQAYRDLQRLKEQGLKKKEDYKISTSQQAFIKNDGDKNKSVSPCEGSSNSQLVTKTDKEMLNQAASTSESKSNVQANSEPNWGHCHNTIQPIAKPPHLRSKKSLKRIEIYDIGLNTPKHVCARKLLKQQNVQIKPENPIAVEVRAKPIATKPRSVLTMTGTREIPPIPKTSVQFHKSWSAIKDNSHLCYQYLKQIPAEELANIFKESLESRMFSNILETLACECDSVEEGSIAFAFLQGLTTVKRFSTLVLFMSSSDKSNLTKLFEHLVTQRDSSPIQIEQLQRIYEM